MRAGLQRTGSQISQVFTGTRIDEELYEELEAALLQSDAGVQATQHLLEDLKRRVKANSAQDPQAVKQLLADAGYGPAKPLTITMQLRPYPAFTGILDIDEAVAKVSIVGAGMRSQPGVALRCFRALGQAGVNIMADPPVKKFKFGWFGDGGHGERGREAHGRPDSTFLQTCAALLAWMLAPAPFKASTDATDSVFLVPIEQGVAPPGPGIENRRR